MARDPHCYWCGCEVIWYKPDPHDTLPLNFATLDHVNSRVLYPGGRPLRGETVLACRECNEERARIEQKQLGLGELRRRSGRGFYSRSGYQRALYPLMAEALRRAGLAPEEEEESA